MYDENRLYFGKSGTGQPSRKTYLSEVRQGKTVGSLWPHSEVGHTAAARLAVKGIFQDRVDAFDNPKPVPLIDRTLRIGTGGNAIVLDSFAGSGTTAHAVLALNKEDGGNRQFILVECEDYADTITAERVRRVIKGVPTARDPSLQEGLGGQFTYCTLGDPIDLELMLSGESLPPYAELAAYLLYTASGVTVDGRRIVESDGAEPFYRDGDTDYYLRYQPDVEWLGSPKAALTEDGAQAIHKAQPDRRAVIFAAQTFIPQRALSKLGITFCQLPYELHRSE